MESGCYHLRLLNPEALNFWTRTLTSMRTGTRTCRERERERILHIHIYLHNRFLCTAVFILPLAAPLSLSPSPLFGARFIALRIILAPLFALAFAQIKLRRHGHVATACSSSSSRSNSSHPFTPVSTAFSHVGVSPIAYAFGFAHAAYLGQRPKTNSWNQTFYGVTIAQWHQYAENEIKTKTRIMIWKKVIKKLIK